MPGPDRRAAGLNLCNSMGTSVHLRPYASASGPLFGAQRSSGRQGFAPLAPLAPGRGDALRSCVRGPGEHLFIGGVAHHLDPVPRGTTR